MKSSKLDGKSAQQFALWRRPGPADTAKRLTSRHMFSHNLVARIIYIRYTAQISWVQYTYQLSDNLRTRVLSTGLLPLTFGQRVCQ